MSETNNNIMVKTDELGIQTGGYSKHFILYLKFLRQKKDPGLAVNLVNTQVH